MAERQKREAESQQALAYNMAALTGLALCGKLKTFAEQFPPLEDVEEQKQGVGREGAAILGALFKMKHRGIPMEIERISLH